MLARAKRLVRAADYRAAVRRGRRFSTPNLVIYVRDRHENSSSLEDCTRFGFIVSRAVGNAVVRNTVRRRLKAICYTLDEQRVLTNAACTHDIVFRANPDAAAADFATLSGDVDRLLTRCGFDVSRPTTSASVSP